MDTHSINAGESAPARVTTLSQREAWLQAVLEATRDGVLVEDSEVIVFVNHAYLTLFGYERSEDLIGRHVSILMVPEEQERMLGFGRRRVCGESAPTVYEFKGRHRDGRQLDLEASVSHSMVAGRHYITTAIRDISERKRADEALRRAHEELEERVSQRTAELVKAYAALQTEAAERKQAEQGRKQLLRQLVAAQEEERRRIARELHDQMGQPLTAILMGLKSLSVNHPGGAGDVELSLDRVQRLQVLTEHLAHKVHTLAWELRPAALDDLGLQTALYNYAEQWSELSRVSIDVHCHGIDGRRFPAHLETTLYRVVQEALTNVLKHAGADRVSLIVELRLDGDLIAVVEDNGLGFDAEAVLAAPIKERRLGLLGMRERVALVGGTLDFESAPGVGTSVFVRIPGEDKNHGD